MSTSDDAGKVYADIIELPHHSDPNRRHMSLYDRAAQFAPFAALSGYDEMVNEEARLTDDMSELSDYNKELLDRNMGMIAEALSRNRIPVASVKYFIPDEFKCGGSYQTVIRAVKSVDIVYRRLILYGSDDIDNRQIPNIEIGFDRLCSVVEVTVNKNENGYLPDTE